MYICAPYLLVNSSVDGHFSCFYILAIINSAAVTISDFPGGSVIKNPPANAGDVGLILGWKDPLEEGMATHSGIFSWEIPWTEGPGRPQSIRSQRVRHD